MKAIVKEAKNYIISFLEWSTIHGLYQLVIPRRHPCEILLWLNVVTFSAYGSFYLSASTWTRYQLSPTVVSMDRDMYSWNTTFPAATICIENKIDEEKLNELLRNVNEIERVKMDEFLRALSNATFDNFHKIPLYNSIAPEDYLKVLLALAPSFQPVITLGTDFEEVQMSLIVTEMGLCYGINSHVGSYTLPDSMLSNRSDATNSRGRTFLVHPLDGEVFGQVLNIPDSFDAYVHGPFEIPDISSKYYHSLQLYYLKLTVTAVEVYTTPSAARLSVAQRRCRFLHENNLEHFPVYSYTMCRMECRIRLCLKYCQCIPFFYRKSGGEVICDPKGMHCLSKYKDQLNTLKDKQGKKIGCECYPICDEVNYVIQFSPLQPWPQGTHFQWGIVTYPRIRYRRDILFGFTDVLVAVGSMAGLFLGCSVLSFLEIVYFVTLRLYFYIYNTMKK